jgi:uncharacterized protein YjbJ (UPF0337 family)
MNRWRPQRRHTQWDSKTRRETRRRPYAGKAKDVVGRATGDKDLETEGKAEQVVGHLKQAGEKVKDAARSAVDDQK